MMTVAPTIARGRVSPWEWAQAALLGANLIWTTLCLGGYRPETMAITLVLTGGALVVNVLEQALGKNPEPGTRGNGWIMLPFLGYALINVLVVTPVRWLGWIDFLGWANLGVAFWLVQSRLRDHRLRQMLFMVLVTLGIVGVLLASYQRFVRPDWLMLGRTQADQFLSRSAGPFGIPNSFAGFLLLLIPPVGALGFRRGVSATERVWWVWVLAVMLFGLTLTLSRGGWIALAAALVLWPLLGRDCDWRKRVVAAVVVFALVVVTAVLVFESVPSARERFGRLVRDAGEVSRPILWRAAWGIFREHPLVGGGAGSFDVHFERFRPERFRDEPQWAHNEYLNTLSDYGTLGIVLLFAPMAMALARARRARNKTTGSDFALETPLVRTGLAIGALAFAFQAVVDFHLKIPALALALAVTVALAFGREPEPAAVAATPVRASGASRAGWFALTLALIVALMALWRFYRGEALRYGARQLIEQTLNRPRAEMPSSLARAELELRRATELVPGNAAAWSDLAFVLELRAFADPMQVPVLARPAVEAAETATTLAAAVPEFWIRLGVAHDMQSRRSDAARAFEKAVKLAPRSANAWYYYANHLSFATDQREAALRAIATCLSLDPGNRAAEALQAKINER